MMPEILSCLLKSKSISRSFLRAFGLLTRMVLFRFRIGVGVGAALGSGLGLCLFLGSSIAQPQQLLITNPEVDSVLKGTFNPARYHTNALPTDIGGILKDMATEISRDSLESYLKQAVSFYNRNTGSDTLSNSRGMGATRRWAFKKFQDFSAKNGGRLLVTYLQFNQAICGVNQHRNVLAVLPGQDIKNHALVMVEAHMDTRCETSCGITCKSEGADDNGSGVAIVLELARVLSKYQFRQTVVFMLTTGEEQGLYGAMAMAKYSKDQGIAIRSVQNNDVVGGILCGPTSSPPSCPTLNAIDSTHVRIFSAAINFSMNKALGRFIKSQYEQWIKPTAAVPMEIVLMDPIDRTGRGGDHEPFSDLGYAAIRFTESYEYGNGNSIPEQGRQHTVLDVIGRDTNGDGKFDSLFVDFNYLRRNTIINAVGLVGAALGPQTPDFDTATVAKGYIGIAIKTANSPQGKYKVAVRTNSNDFAVVYAVSDTASFILPNTKTGTTYYIAVASVDASGAQSLYSQEKAVLAKVEGPPVWVLAPLKQTHTSWRLSPPRLFLDHISWTILGGSGKSAHSMLMRITDAGGRTVRSQSFRYPGVGQTLEVALYSKIISPGIYQVTLESDGKRLDAQALRIPNHIKIP